MPVLIPINQLTARVNGGRLKVMGSRVRRTNALYVGVINSTRLMSITAPE
jgi:hypothetical protein